jgi:hypothetical protein
LRAVLRERETDEIGLCVASVLIAVVLCERILADGDRQPIAGERLGVGDLRVLIAVPAYALSSADFLQAMLA